MYSFAYYTSDFPDRFFYACCSNKYFVFDQIESEMEKSVEEYNRLDREKMKLSNGIVIIVLPKLLLSRNRLEINFSETTI